MKTAELLKYSSLAMLEIEKRMQHLVNHDKSTKSCMLPAGFKKRCTVLNTALKIATLNHEIKANGKIELLNKLVSEIDKFYKQMGKLDEYINKFES